MVVVGRRVDARVCTEVQASTKDSHTGCCSASTNPMIDVSMESYEYRPHTHQSACILLHTPENKASKTPSAIHQNSSGWHLRDGTAGLQQVALALERLAGSPERVDRARCVSSSLRGNYATTAAVVVLSCRILVVYGTWYLVCMIRQRYDTHTAVLVSSRVASTTFSKTCMYILHLQSYIYIYIHACYHGVRLHTAAVLLLL